MDTLINIVICDNDEATHKTAHKLIENFSQTQDLAYRIIDIYSGEELIECKKEFQALYLDVDMPGMDGIEAAKTLRKRGWNGKIIMLTGKEDCYKEAFKIGAIRFVSKPVSETEFFESLERLKEVMPGYGVVDLCYSGIEVPVRVRDISYIESAGDFIKIHAGKKQYEKNISLKGMADELDERIFVLTHKSYIVNASKIESLGHDAVILTEGIKIPLSRRRRQEVKKAYIRYDTENF